MADAALPPAPAAESEILDDEALDPNARDEWHVIAHLGAFAASPHLAAPRLETRLLGTKLSAARGADGGIEVRAAGRRLPVRHDFGYLWTTLGTPRRPLFAIPEAAEPDRRLVHAASIGVGVAAPRAIENFLDLGHFPYVHTGYLGAEPDTEVAPYEVRIDENEVVASNCRFRQPRAAANAEGALEVTYIYRVPHPYCAVLYKINPIARERMDVIALFAQPTGPEETRAHMFVALLDATSSTAALTSFQQEVFAQDKPILENQLPKRLPLDPRAEVSVRADACSVAYRRFLSARGVRYGTLPA